MITLQLPEKVVVVIRTPIGDSAKIGRSGDGKFTQRDRKRFIEVSGETVRSGVLPEAVVDRLFSEQKSAKSVAVRFWPLVMARKSSHGAARIDGLPEIVAPVVTEATLDRDGEITSLRNALARDVLSSNWRIAGRTRVANFMS